MNKDRLDDPLREHIILDDTLIDFMIKKHEAKVSAVDNGPMLSFLVNINEPVFAWVNDTVIEVLGYSREELNKINFLDLIHPDDLELTAYAFEKQKMVDINNWAFKNRYKKKDESYATLIWASAPIQFGNYMINQALWLEGLTEFIDKWKVK